MYDLVSVQYHALKAATTYGKYEQDAQGHDDVQQFFRQCAEQDAERAQRCHQLLGAITSGTACRVPDRATRRVGGVEA